MLALYLFHTHPVLASFFIRGVSLTHPTVALIFCGEFLTHHMLAFLFKIFKFWGVPLTHSVLASFFIRGVSLTHPTVALIFCGEFLTHHMLAFLFKIFKFWGVPLTHSVLASFLCGEFLLHIP